MCKYNFKVLLLILVVAVCFSNNLSAMQEVTEKQIDKSSLHLKEDAAFIEEFVKAVDAPKVQHDGKTLKLYLDTSSSEKRALIFMVVCMFLGLGCFLASDNRHDGRGEHLFVSGMLWALIGVISELYATISAIVNSSTPFLVIDSEQIATRNNIKMKWTDASIMKFLNDNSVMICNKEGIPLFVIDNNNLPIKLSELIVILGFYLKEYGEKGRDLHVQK